MRRLELLTSLLLLLLLAAAPYFLSSYHLSLLGRFLALSILAIGLSFVWGWSGILSLGQGVFFGLGAYALAMYLKLVSLGAGELPDFMEWSGVDHLPWWWNIFHRPGVAIAAVVLAPTIAAGVLAWLVFHRRVGGVYFALLTQALALAFTTLLISQQPYTGGFNGLTDFSTVFGYPLIDPPVQRALYWITLAALAVAFSFSRRLQCTDFGRVLVAIRTGENRIRFLGYNPASFKVAVFALGGMLAGIAGAFFTLHVGVISPAMIGVMPSIEMVIWVAIGGRKSLLGAVIGTLLVNFGKDWISSAMPSAWLFIMGLLFVVTVMVLPDGLAGIPDNFRRMRSLYPQICQRMTRVKHAKEGVADAVSVADVRMSCEGAE